MIRGPGIDGVNIHTFPGTGNQLFGFTETTTGALAGLSSTVTLKPSASPHSVAPYAITRPAASAAMLTIAPQRRAPVRP
jgi:hypothetical protein